MSEISAKMRLGGDRLFHYCPGCKGLDPVFFDRGWTWDGNTEAPTFFPSFKHTNGQGAVCHYVLTAGVLQYQSDCTHELAGQNVPLPDLPPEYRSWEQDLPLVEP